jgi:hypothetical protein
LFGVLAQIEALGLHLVELRQVSDRYEHDDISR